MVRIVGMLGDRLLATLCPRVEVHAGPICDPNAYCRNCGYQGSMQMNQWYQIWSNCKEYYGPCLVNNNGCAVK
ncbi:MAG: hypothetical protein V7603_4350 [Micromonosporaceae bacterium]|jgi:hypothetical protein